MKIVHISDLHYPKTEENTQKLITQIIDYYSHDIVKPVVVISGDILHSSTRKTNFREVKKILAELRSFGYHLLICPGNHDLKVEGIAPVIVGRQRFDNYFRSLLPKGFNYFGEEDNNLLDFPIVHQFDDHFFIGLDTLAEENGIGATGELGNDQLEELNEIIVELRNKFEQPKIIIYLHHHPLRFTFRPELMKLRDKDDFLDIIRGIDILLFGHLHHHERFPDDELKYDINCIQLSGGCTHRGPVNWTEIDSLTNVVRYLE